MRYEATYEPIKYFKGGTVSTNSSSFVHKSVRSYEENTYVMSGAMGEEREWWAIPGMNARVAILETRASLGDDLDALEGLHLDERRAERAEDRWVLPCCSSEPVVLFVTSTRHGFDTRL